MTFKNAYAIPFFKIDGQRFSVALRMIFLFSRWSMTFKNVYAILFNRCSMTFSSTAYDFQF